MSVYVYAICDGTAPSPASGGIAGEPLRMVRSGSLAALVSSAPSDPPDELLEGRLWEHERVIEGLMSERDVLPARFGGVLEGEDAVRELLSARSAELCDALVQVAGCVELAVRALVTGDVPRQPGDAPGSREAAGSGGTAGSGVTGSSGTAAGSGTVYLAAAEERRRMIRDLGERIEAELGPLARDVRIRVPVTQPPSISAAFLVPREQVSSFAAKVDELSEELTGGELVCTGPWPPYSFVEPVGAR